MRFSVADGRPGGKRIFVAEDEALVRLMLGEMLGELGHEIVAEASRIDRAIEIARAAEFDLAVLDLNLGHGISYEVADIVLGRGKPVVLSTGYGETGLNSRYDRCVVVQKPFTRDALARAIEQSFRQASAGGADATGG